MQRKMPNPPLYNFFLIIYLKFPIGDIVPNWIFSSISPLVDSRLNVFVEDMTGVQ